MSRKPHIPTKRHLQAVNSITTKKLRTTQMPIDKSMNKVVFPNENAYTAMKMNKIQLVKEQR